MTDVDETDGPLADPSLLDGGRQIVPAEHAPRLECVEISLSRGIDRFRFRVRERDDPKDAWIEAENAVEVVE